MACWRTYWSAGGGRIGVAALRIAIGCSLLWTLARLATHAGIARSALYYPHGIWLAFPGKPGPVLLAALAVVAWPSTIAFTIGLATRRAHAISLVSTLALATFEVSGLSTWTHQNVPPLLASIAFLGARGGDALSVDAWVRSRRGLPPLDVAGAYQWTVRLVQLTVASVFFVAACCKVLNGGPELGWALSDNLRHQLLMRFDWIHLPRTAAADWIMARSWRYEAFAAANLCSQLSPIGAVFAVRRPVVRALLGLIWIGEVLGLGVVMALWDTHWLPLAAAFVDWDVVVAALRARSVTPRGTSPVPPSPPRMRFIACFLAFYAAQAFGLNQRLNLYPFSSYPMFSEVRARLPYDRHQSYELIGGRIEVIGRGLTDRQQRWIDARIGYRWLWRERRPEALRTQLQGVLDETRHRFPAAEITGVRLWLVVDRAPAYPAPARLDRFDLAIIGELDATGQLRAALGSLEGSRVVALPGGLDLGAASLIAYRDDAPDAIAVPAARTSDGFALDGPPAGDPLYLAALVGGQPWLVAQRTARGY